MLAVELIFNEVSPLKPVERLQLIDKILNSLNPSDKKLEDIWAKEAEDRIEAYDRGLISTVNEDDVFLKYRR
jgi:putative addiction module component (TIGR02574 family)